MPMIGFQELLILAGIIVLLVATGMWPAVSRAIRDILGAGREIKQAATEDLEIPYKLLGISPSSKWDEIEQAYYRKARLHHPDHGGDSDTMRALNEAYQRIKRARGR